MTLLNNMNSNSLEFDGIRNDVHLDERSIIGSDNPTVWKQS